MLTARGCNHSCINQEIWRFTISDISS
uniref:Uncharacterized protein n=1 Tax=Oryza meridionalis TaxID=40149 RepID=A0A0E0CJ21_9ORYZ